MTTAQTSPAPTDPLAGDLQTVHVVNPRTANGFHQTRGRVVAPGLAITASADTDQPHPNRYRLTHLPTGLALGTPHCGVHIHAAVQVAVGSGIGWTAGKDTVTAAAQQIGLAQQLRPLLCRRWCDGDGPKPPSWGVSCTTCGWQSDEDRDGPLDADDARRLADDHMCEPDVHLEPPNTDKAALAEPWGGPGAGREFLP